MSFSRAQMETLVAICDTFLPSIDGDHLRHHSHDVLQFYQTSASMAGTPHRVAEFLHEKAKHPKLHLVKLGVRMLSSPVGTLVLCGTKSLSPKFPFVHKFSKLSPHKREQVMTSWSASYFKLFRTMFVAFKTFTLLIFFTQVNDKKENISWKALGYSGPDPARKPNPELEKQENPSSSLGPLHDVIIDFSKDTSLDKLRTLGFPVSTPPENTKPGSPSLVITCDAVVVGSGSGGGVVAGILAKAGHRVLVVEKGGYFSRGNLSLLEGEALDQMYLNGGVMATEDMNVLLLAGSTVGGGSTINWSASIRTPDHVTNEWSKSHGLELFGSETYQQALDAVCGRMGVQSEIDDESFHNMILRKGCERMNYPVETIPRNAPADHYCGWCCWGCSDGRKKGTAETWLVDMVESGNGAILTGSEALEVIKDGKKAVGVTFAFGNERKIGKVEAKVTVVACGALRTPSLLKRSGLKNPNIGRNLHLHPVAMGWGYFPEGNWPELRKRSYEGGIMTAMSKVAAGFDGTGYGAIIQTPSLHPGLFTALFPWVSGRVFKDRMVKYSRIAHVFALARDRGSGEVLSESDVRYDIEEVDQVSLKEGIETVLRILAAAGAEEIGTHYREGRVLRVKGASEEEVERFIREESDVRYGDLSGSICSAHQMGSCRMGVGPEVSAVDQRGETWEVEGLFVADTSVFPTALGVNPMVTVQAVSYCTAQSILEVLGKKENGVE